jgi:hypothetical protein
MSCRKKLSDILLESDRDNIKKSWADAEAAKEFGPLPRGEYIARIVDASPIKAKTGTPGFQLAFKVLEGEFAGRMFWKDIWLTSAAIPMAKRDLGKLGVTDLDQLDQPFPQGIRCKVKLGLQEDDDGNERNRVQSFEVVAIDPPEADPFAPPDEKEPVQP